CASTGPSSRTLTSARMLRLEREAGPEPELTVGTVGRADDAERAGIRDIAPWIREVDVVQHIDSFNSELQSCGSGERQRTEQTQIEIEVSRSADRVSTRVPEPLRLARGNVHRGVGARVEVRMARTDASQDRHRRFYLIRVLRTARRVQVSAGILDDID